MRRRLAIASVALLAVSACSQTSPQRAEVLERALAAGAGAAPAERQENGPQAFVSFRQVVAQTAFDLGETDLAQELRALVPGRPVEPGQAELASRLLRTWVVTRYADSIVRDLREMIGFRTFHAEGRDNWDAPEFLRQREWLESRAADLGLEFGSVDGRVEEITLPGAARVIGVLTHGDVQDVVGQHWSRPPWEGRLEQGRIYGRGSEDDKGPIVTTLYVFAALRDSGWPLDATLRLIVANGEECCWEEIPYYLERRRPPDVTIGFDASYPVTHAQKAWCRVTLTAPADPRGFELRDAAERDAWHVVSMRGGDGLSIIPERGEALLYRPGTGDGAVDALRHTAERWTAGNPKARIVIEPAGDYVRVEAIGRGGHSSTPDAGRNALGDLTAFLRHATNPTGSYGSLAHALGEWVGTETDGRALGLAHRDEVMGALTVNLAYLEPHEGAAGSRLTLRVPRGMERETIERELARRAAEFEARHGAAIEFEVYMPNPPHFVPADGPLVETLLGVWESVTGQAGRPVAIGGGTQARLFPDGVDFGPGHSMERYRGHGPDEYMTVGEIRRNAELTVAALWALSQR